MYTLFAKTYHMVKPITSKETWASLKPEKSVAEEFQKMQMCSEDGIRLTTVSQKLQRLMNVYKTLYRD